MKTSAQSAMREKILAGARRQGKSSAPLLLRSSLAAVVGSGRRQFRHQLPHIAPLDPGSITMSSMNTGTFPLFLRHRRQRQPVFRARQRHIKQPPLFLDVKLSCRQLLLSSVPAGNSNTRDRSVAGNVPGSPAARTHAETPAPSPHAPSSTAPRRPAHLLPG